MLTHYKYLIIGGGIAGTSAAETIRSTDTKGTVGIVSSEPHRLYSRVMLSKPEFYTKKNAQESIFLKQQEWYSGNNIDFLSNTIVVALNTAQKQITLHNGEVLSYEKLLLAVGAHPRPLPDLEGVDAGRILYLHTLDHAREIIQHLDVSGTVLVVGGGFISFELCSLFTTLGKKVISVIISPRYWRSVFDETSSRFIEDALIKNGVKVFTESKIKKLVGSPRITEALLQHTQTKEETTVPCSTVIAAIGTQRVLGWIENAGVKINKGILTNEYMETSIPDIWAAGDCAEYFDVILGKSIALENWMSARMNGAVAGRGMIGQRTQYRKTTFYATQKLGLSIGFIGDTNPIGESGMIIPRGSFEYGAYAQLRIVNDRIVGATLINMSNDLSTLVTLIENKIPISNYLKELGDPTFNLATLKNNNG